MTFQTMPIFSNLKTIPSHPWRVLVFVLLFALAMSPGYIGEAARTSMGGAYVSVAVFVYLTLLAFYWVEVRFNINLINKFEGRPRAQVVAAALFGVMPGCGGAILVVTGYASGRLTFGAMVATLTATMGDAAFLLIAQDPLAALIILPTSVVVGMITGIVVDYFYPNKFHAKSEECSFAVKINKFRFRDKIMMTMFVPGLIMGIMGLAQIELPIWTGSFALVGMLATLAVWAFSPIGQVTHADDNPMTRANEETAFVMIWVSIAFLLFDVSLAIFGFDLGNLFGGIIWLTPLIATLVGFLPGCGPQIITTTLYLTGAIPLGALMSNAISNDGDALFPALAIAPRDAILATLITALPALVAGYGYMILFGF